MPNDVLGILYVAGLATLLSSAGIATDKLLLDRQKGKLRETFTNWWVFLDDLQFRDIATDTARGLLYLKNQLFGERLFSPRFLVIAVTVSVCVTTTAIIAGDAIWYSDKGGPSAAIGYFPQRKPVWLYLSNFVLDYITLTVTFALLAVFVRVNAAVRIGVVTLDFVVALLLAVLCWFVGKSLEFPDTAYIVTGDPSFIDATFRQYFGYWQKTGMVDVGVLSFGYIEPWDVNDGEWGSFFFANTTFIPTAFFALLLFALTILFMLFHVTRFFVLQILGLSVETEKSVFFYAGTTMGLLAILTKLLNELWKLVDVS